MGGIASSALVAVALAGLVSVSALGVLSADLPDPSALAEMGFAEPTIVYDRDGKVELGRFQDERRRVVAYADIPPLILDATTTAEDRTFWDNAGIDPAALVSAVAENASGVSERGASTITQQLVRARLLPEEIINGSDRYLRKAKEIVQSLRLTDEYPGTVGKERVISAYLNEIYYGHEAYGIAAAADVYFGVTDLTKLTVAQAALLAGLPKSPSTMDPYRFAVKDDKGRLVVPATAEPVVRRDWILEGLTTAGRWTKLDPAALRSALAEPVILAGERPIRIPGGHFTWQVRRQLQAILGPEVDLKRAGYRVITTLDWRAQKLAERWVGAAAIAPNISRKKASAMLDQLKIPASDRRWITA
ncbi:MAG TPA: transglycosylase domain-containing protein, partial [Methylomirabilota bacterium]|nr:transglycosylase domain-containing protein [Methylomirabilota bacterium]